jgi:copper chaperone CopZ
MASATYTVWGMHCTHCKSAIETELDAVVGVDSVDVDLESNMVTVHGSQVDDEAVRAAIAEAGYEAA